MTTQTPATNEFFFLLQLILFANTSAFFYSLLGLVSHCFWEGDSGEEISLFEKAYKPAFHIYRAFLKRFFYAYSVFVDGFVIVFFLDKHSIPHSAVLSLTNILRLCQVMPLFWSRWLLFSVW